MTPAPAPAPGGRGWRRRVRRPPPAGPLACAGRGARILVLLLGVTGCAVDPPQPVDGPGTAETRRETPGAAAPPAVVSRFGEWRGEGPSPRPGRHAGIDIRAPVGTPVLAAADGVVLRTGARVRAGRLVVLGHADDLATVYFHLSAVAVEPGQLVRRGQVIGRVGATGNATAPHLHFGVCRREAGQCGPAIEAGWDDPMRHWVPGNPCFVAGRAAVAREAGLTYPVACPGGAAGVRVLAGAATAARRAPAPAR